MGLVIMVLQFLTALCLIVFIHELGHYLAARMFGVPVKKIYLFFDVFGVALFRRKFRGTEYGIGWLPFGGYLLFDHQMTTENIDSDNQAKVTDYGVYLLKTVWQRMIIMLSGIMMNLFFAMLVFAGISLCYGRNQVTGIGKSSSIIPGTLGKQAGLRIGDEVTAINADSALYEDELLSTHLMQGHTLLSVVRKLGNERIHMHIAVSPKIMQLVADKGLTQFFAIEAKYKADSVYSNVDLRQTKAFKTANIVALNGDSVHDYNEFIIRLAENKDHNLHLTVIHDGRTSILPAHRDNDGHIGFSLESKMPPVVPINLSVTQSLKTGTSRVWGSVAANASGFSDIVSGKVKVSEGLAGPIKIAEKFGDSPDYLRFWSLVALMSIGVAIFNLLPLAPLDGGALLLLLWEKLRGAPIGQNHKEVYQGLSLLSLLLLTVFVFYNDIHYLIQNQ